MTPKIITESATEPIELDEAAENLRLFRDANSPPGWVEGPRVTKLIKAARQACENELEMSLVEKTLEVAQSAFHPCPIELPYGPVRSIVSVTYKDTTGADVVLAADQYRFSAYESMAVLWPAYGVTFPTARCDLDSVRVRYTAGYPSADSPPEEVPETIRQAMHLYIAHYFENRKGVDDDTLAELPLGARHLLSPDRRGLGV